MCCKVSVENSHPRDVLKDSEWCSCRHCGIIGKIDSSLLNGPFLVVDMTVPIQWFILAASVHHPTLSDVAQLSDYVDWHN